MILESIPVNKCSILPSWKKANLGALLQIKLGGNVNVGMRCSLPGATKDDTTDAIIFFDGTAAAPKQDFPALLVSGYMEIGVQNAGLSLHQSKFNPGMVYALAEGPMFLCSEVNQGRVLICIKSGPAYVLGDSYFNVGSMPALFEVGAVELKPLPVPVRVVGD
jgi:hypothetical protein